MLFCHAELQMVWDAEMCVEARYLSKNLFLAPLQGSWIGKAKTEGLFRFAQSCAVGADIIHLRNLRRFIVVHLVGCGDLDAPLPR